MSTPQAIAEFRRCWIPNTPRSALVRLAELLRDGSPLLIHGRFTQVAPQGCLATQIAWHHPLTRHLDVEAGVTWLTQVARLNPATSSVVTEWDRLGVYDFELRNALLTECEYALQNVPDVERLHTNELCPA